MCKRHGLLHDELADKAEGVVEVLQRALFQGCFQLTAFQRLFRETKWLNRTMLNRQPLYLINQKINQKLWLLHYNATQTEHALPNQLEQELAEKKVQRRRLIALGMEEAAVAALNSSEVLATLPGPP